MKIILYLAGREGVGAVLPGENPEMELADLLGGGEVEMIPITRRLMLVTAADAEKRQLPVRYALRRMGRADEPVCGNCAVAEADARQMAQVGEDPDEDARITQALREQGVLFRPGAPEL